MDLWIAGEKSWEIMESLARPRLKIKHTVTQRHIYNKHKEIYIIHGTSTPHYVESTFPYQVEMTLK